jgi:HSP20 family protein
MYHITRYQYPSRANLFSSVAAEARHSWSGLETEIDRLFASALTNLASPASTRQIPVDLYQDQENSYVRAELPGVTRDAINIELADGVLKLSATRKTPGATSEESSTLERSISVPETVQADKVSATYENGVLLVTLPKQEQVKPRKITVAVN